MIRQYNKGINLINVWLRDIAAMVLASLAIVVVLNVILRIFGMAITGVYDLTVILTPVAIALSIAYCAIKDGHVAIGMLVERFPKRVQKIIDAFIGSITTAILLMAAWYVMIHAGTMWKNHEVTTTIKIPFAPVIVIIAVGILMLALVVLGKVLNLFDKEGEQ